MVNRQTRRAAERAARDRSAVPPSAPGGVIVPRVMAFPSRVEVRVPAPGVLVLDPAQAERLAELLRLGATEARRAAGAA